MHRWPMAVFVLLSACTGYGVVRTEVPALEPFARVREDLAEVCVFRASVIGSLLTVPVRDNGLVVGATEGPSYFCYYAGPGLHTVTVDVSDAPALKLIARPGTRHFLEQVINIGQDELLLVNADRARRLSAELEYALVNEAPDNEPLPPRIPTVPGLR